MREERNELINKVSAIPAKMTKAARIAAGRPEPADAWPARTILIHEMAVDTEIWQMRLEMLAEQENPQWPWAEPDVEQWLKECEHLSLNEVAEKFAEGRGEIVAYLRSLDHASWLRTGTHATYGVMDVAALCNKMLEHDLEHLKELEGRFLNKGTG